MSIAVTDVVSKISKFDLIEDGQVFRQGHYYLIADEGVAYMLLRVGEKYPHIFLDATADGDVEIEVLIYPTVTTTGDEEPSGNFNFNSDNVSLMKWYITPTLADEGIHVATTHIIGGSGVSTPSGAKSSATMTDFDIILIPDTDFLLKFTNHAGRTVQVMFESVYRETDRDSS